jgi:hypothetical protein
MRLLEDGYFLSQARAERRLAKHTRSSLSMQENRIVQRFHLKYLRSRLLVCVRRN